MNCFYRRTDFIYGLQHIYIYVHILDETPLNADEKLDSNKETGTVPNEVGSQTAADQTGLAFTLIRSLTFNSNSYQMKPFGNLAKLVFWSILSFKN